MIEFILYVADQERSKNFYQEVLAMQPVLDVPGMTEFQLNDFCKLGLMPENGIVKILGDKTPHPATGNGIPRCEVYYYVPDIDAIVKRLIKADAKEINPVSDRDWGDRVGYFSDPDGHILAVAHKIA
jgi:catechol 2,3-dioxygenase-like lactoylglutathione lyase family enzyme